MTDPGGHSEIQQAIRSFWRRDGHEYDQSQGHGSFSPDERTLWRGFVGSITAPSRVLDVGTGTGFVALLLAEMGHRVTAVDWSSNMMATAQAKAAQAGVEVGFTIAEADDLPFESDSFEIVTARHVVWTLLDPRRAFEEWGRVLAAGGTLVFDFSPGRAGAHYPANVEEALPMRGVDNEEPIVQLIYDAGFAQVESVRVGREGHERQNVVFVAKR